MPEEGDATVDVWRRTVDLPGPATTPLETAGARFEPPELTGFPQPARPSASLSELAELTDWAGTAGVGIARGEPEDPLAGLMSAVIPIVTSPQVAPDRILTPSFVAPPLPAPEEITRPRGGQEVPEAPVVPATLPEKERWRFHLPPRATGSLLLALVEGAASRSAGVLVRYLFALLLLLVLAIFFIAYLAWR
jgi:hypothetical protein